MEISHWFGRSDEVWIVFQDFQWKSGSPERRLIGDEKQRTGPGDFAKADVRLQLLILLNQIQAVKCKSWRNLNLPFVLDVC